MGQLITGEYGVIEKNGKPVVSSRYIASNFSKQHSHVLRDIQTAVENFSQIGQSRFGLSNFIKSTYKNEQNKKQPEYLLTYDGFSYIVMGFTGKKASEFKVMYINEFNKMGNFIKNLLEAKADFPEFTDAITQAHTEPKFCHYSAELDMINRIVTGMSAKQFKISNNLDIKTTSIRPHLTPQQLEAVKALQRIDIGLVHAVTDFQQRKSMLEQQYMRLSQRLLKSA